MSQPNHYYDEATILEHKVSKSNDNLDVIKTNRRTF